MDWFWGAKGVLALVGTCLLIWHMARKREPMSRGQLLRYLALLYFSVLITGTSADQAQSHPPVNWYNVAVLPGVLLLVAAAAVSLRESRHR